MVRITAPPGLVDTFLAPRLVELASRYPRLRIQILSTVGYADLTRHEADLALRVVRPAAGDLVAIRLASQPYCTLGGVEHAQLAAVRAGLGVMLAPVAYADLPGLVAVDCTPRLRRSLAALPEGALWLVGHRALRDVPRIAAVWEWLVGTLSSPA